jgi:hypothetical protein
MLCPQCDGILNLMGCQSCGWKHGDPSTRNEATNPRKSGKEYGVPGVGLMTVHTGGRTDALPGFNVNKDTELVILSAVHRGLAQAHGEPPALFITAEIVKLRLSDGWGRDPRAFMQQGVSGPLVGGPGLPNPLAPAPDSVQTIPYVEVNAGSSPVPEQNIDHSLPPSTSADQARETAPLVQKVDPHEPGAPQGLRDLGTMRTGKVQ